MKVIEQSDTPFKTYILQDDTSSRDLSDANNFLTFLSVSGKSPHTVRSYAYHLSIFFDFCEQFSLDYMELFKTGSRPVDTMVSFMTWLQYPDYSKKILHLEKEGPIRSNSTVNIIVGTVLSFYEYLASNKQIEDPSFYRYQRVNTPYVSFLSELMHHELYYKRSILMKPTVPKVIHPVTRAQYAELIKYCTSRRDRLLLALLFEGGLRLSEALGIHLSDLSELEQGIISIIPRENNENGARVKNYAKGIIKVPDYVIDVLLKYLDEIKAYDSDYLFLNIAGRNKGQPLKADTVEKMFLTLSKKAGYKVHPHMLRHGFATEKLEAGWQMVDIQAYLRHKSINSTHIYATYSDELKKEKMRSFLVERERELLEIANEIRQ